MTVLAFQHEVVGLLDGARASVQVPAGSRVASISDDEVGYAGCPRFRDPGSSNA